MKEEWASGQFDRPDYEPAFLKPQRLATLQRRAPSPLVLFEGRVRRPAADRRERRLNPPLNTRIANLNEGARDSASCQYTARLRATVHKHCTYLSCNTPPPTRSSEQKVPKADEGCRVID